MFSLVHGKQERPIHGFVLVSTACLLQHCPMFVPGMPGAPSSSYLQCIACCKLTVNMLLMFLTWLCVAEW